MALAMPSNRNVGRPKQFAEVKTERSALIAELASRYADLWHARGALARVTALLKKDSRDAVGVHSFWASALTSYGRSFGTGKLRSTKGTKILRELVAGHVQMHESIIWRRNQEVAHAVESAFDDAVVGAEIEVDDEVLAFTGGVGLRDLRVFAPPLADVEIIYRHVDVLHARLAGVIKRETATLAREIADASAEGKNVFGRDVSALFRAGAAQLSDALGMTLEVTSHDVSNEMRKSAGRKPTTVSPPAGRMPKSS